ncbi:MAG: putative toxin-antitoxin system toxin component, PIN family [Dehalococcoidia bacterium]|nr:putative toxin-antitoxin system toxin component, PIN family [Dehalococcoidia bacterium]
MLRVVLDTNVLVSALINPHGKPAQIMDGVLAGRIRLFVSPSIVTELERVLGYPKLMKRHGLEGDELKQFVLDLLSVMILVSAEETIELIADDPSDNKYLSCALAARADFIVSGDVHLLKLGEHRGIRVVSAAQFIDIMEVEERT